MGVLCATVFLALFVPAAHAAITGSDHDLSGRGWGTDEICKFCHTPHNAKTDIAGSQLWNHTNSSATYTLYDSPTLDNKAEQPRGPSKLCLSCHDGTVAIDAYSNRPGGHFISGAANLGTDLSNDHPISILWTHQYEPPPRCGSCHVSHHGGGFFKPDLPLKDGYMECISCHDAHNKYPDNPPMLRYSISVSELCLKCHEK